MKSIDFDEETLKKMKMKLVLSYEQWKELKRNMYTTFLLFLFIISLSLLYKVSPNWNEKVEINYSNLLNSIIIFLIIFILLSPLKFHTKFSSFLGLITTIQFILFLLCNCIQEKNETFEEKNENFQQINEIFQFLQINERINNLFLLILTPIEKDLICSEIGLNTPVGPFIYWAMYLFIQYMEGNYQKIEKTLRDFEDMEKELKDSLQKKNLKVEKEEEGDEKKENKKSK